LLNKRREPHEQRNPVVDASSVVAALGEPSHIPFDRLAEPAAPDAIHRPGFREVAFEHQQLVAEKGGSRTLKARVSKLVMARDFWA
jgi:hypothetical protein